MNNFWGFMIWNEARRRNRGPSGCVFWIVIIGLVFLAYYIAVGGEWLGLWHR